MTTTNHEHPVWTLLDRMQMDMRQMNARMVELRSQISQIKLDVTEPARCPDCRNTYPGQHDLELHRYQQHNGPIPTTWAIADTRASGVVVVPEPVGSSGPKQVFPNRYELGAADVVAGSRARANGGQVG